MALTSATSSTPKVSADLVSPSATRMESLTKLTWSLKRIASPDRIAWEAISAKSNNKLSRRLSKSKNLCLLRLCKTKSELTSLTTKVAAGSCSTHPKQLLKVRLLTAISKMAAPYI